jgi:hypothetical protein
MICEYCKHRKTCVSEPYEGMCSGFEIQHNDNHEEAPK